MASNVKVQVIGLDKAISDIHSYVSSTQRQLTSVVAFSSSKIQDKAKINASVDLGNMRNNITHVVKQRKDRVTGEITSNEEYSSAVEYGTKPHWTSVENLRGWAERRGISPYAVQRAIAEKGTKPQPFMMPAFDAEKQNFINNVIDVLQSP